MKKNLLYLSTALKNDGEVLGGKSDERIEEKKQKKSLYGADWNYTDKTITKMQNFKDVFLKLDERLDELQRRFSKIRQKLNGSKIA